MSEQTRYIASCSFGKDSMATILLALEHNEPLDAVVYARVMFDETRSAEVPEHEKFIHEVAIPFIKSKGIKVFVFESDKNFKQIFYRKRSKGKRIGQRLGFPMPGACVVNRDLKMPAINKIKMAFADCICYVGIAADEPKRLERLKNSGQISLLEKYGYTGQKAKEICEKYALLFPIYEFTKRNGCFFCPNQRISEIKHLYNHHDELWAELLLMSKAENIIGAKLTRDYTCAQLQEIFTAEDAQMSFENMLEQELDFSSAGLDDAKWGGEIMFIVSVKIQYFADQNTSDLIFEEIAKTFLVNDIKEIPLDDIKEYYMQNLIFDCYGIRYKIHHREIYSAKIIVEAFSDSEEICQILRIAEFNDYEN